MLSHGKAGIDPRCWAYATPPKPLDLEASDFTTAGPWLRFWSLEVRALCAEAGPSALGRRIEPNSSWFSSRARQNTQQFVALLRVADWWTAHPGAGIHLSRVGEERIESFLRPDLALVARRAKLGRVVDCGSSRIRPPDHVGEL